jgi:heparosan-N-sulfate-glucuronate 5-epimerase
MSILSRLQYFRRILRAYLGAGNSQLSFWHDQPAVNPNFTVDALGEYYMPFLEKADYAGVLDENGIPMIDYHGKIGRQYNPIAIAQWGLGNYNHFCRSKNEGRRGKFLLASDWLCHHLEPNVDGISVWNHRFDWEYRTPLKAPWYSALAQGQGISLLVRAHRETGNAVYIQAAERAFISFQKDTSSGGVTFTDQNNNLWFEEYIVSPPTHILNGFLWAAWGVYDFFLSTKNPVAKELFASAVKTLCRNLENYDLGFWSLYEQSGTFLPMVASPFYHRLHIIQLRLMHRLTGEAVFVEYADRWENYMKSRANRTRALCYKSVFKLCYY